MALKLAIIVNNGNYKLMPSETFIRAHIELLPCEVVPVFGMPGLRRINSKRGEKLLSRSLIPLALRWILRKIRISSIENQDRNATIKFLRKKKIDVVMAEYGPTAVSVMEACHYAGIPLIAHFHGYDAYKKTVIEQYRNDYQRLFVVASAVIAVSRDMEAQLKALGSCPSKTFYNSCGADIPLGIQANPANTTKKFVMVGRLVQKKSPLTSLYAFSILAKKNNQVSLDVIGDGPLMDECQEFVKSEGLENSVSFYGAVSHDVVIEKMVTSLCLIQHSVTADDGDKEGTPVGVLEAMGLGLPVVATRHGGIVDVIRDSENGFLVDEHDAVAMADAMYALVHDANLAGRIGVRAREEISRNWSSAESVKNLWKIIEKNTPEPRAWHGLSQD